MGKTTGQVRRRVARTAVGFTALGLGAIGCGGGGDTADPTTTSLAPTTTSSSVAATTSSSSASSGRTTTTLVTPGSAPAALAPGCTPPTADVTYTSGFASVRVTSGPGQGSFDLAVQPRSRSEHRAKDRDLKGEWKDAAGKLLYVNVSGGDPCKAGPSAFVRIEPEGKGGKAFADSGRNRCKVELKAFTSAGVDGSFTCTQLGGGGAGVFIDATGTFFLRP